MIALNKLKNLVPAKKQNATKNIAAVLQMV